MAQPITQIQVTMAQPSKAPVSGIKWKALFDNNNAMSNNKILFCNSHTAEMMPWIGFVRQPGKDFTYTSISLSDEQRRCVIGSVEAQVSKILSQHEWSRQFSLTPTEKIYPKSVDCTFYEKREDGNLYPVNPDVEELHNSPEKGLQVGALLQVAGVFSDFATHKAKLTFKLVSAAYAWTQHQATSLMAASYLSKFGPVVLAEELQQQQQQKQQQQPQPQPMNVIEAAAAVSGIIQEEQQQQQQVIEFDKEAFLASLAKLRTPGGIHRKMRQLQKVPMDTSTREWCEREARRVMYDISAKTEEKRRRKAAEEEEDEAAPPSKKGKPVTLQRQSNEEAFQMVPDQSNDSLGRILLTDDEGDEEGDEDEEDVH